jgi:type II secretory pathway pseudopilin PulG
MKPINGNQSGRIGFTIIELLTVMSIIVVLISLLAPALNRVRRYATDVKQKAQFHSISIGLEAFNADFDGYPDSNAVDDFGNHYCGAMKLAEAMVGQDLKGFNPASRFRRAAFARPNGNNTLYPDTANFVWPDGSTTYSENIKSRRTYLELERANAYFFKDIYADNTADIGIALSGIASGAFDPCTYVLCDSYNRVTNKTTGKKMGMPILYYKADPAKIQIPTSGITISDMQKYAGNYIYNVYDNQALINCGMPWLPSGSPVSSNTHRLASAGSTPEGFSITGTNACPEEFYRIIRDRKIPSGDKPYRANSYILISAGFDGQYGTSDDIYNFGD